MVKLRVEGKLHFCSLAVSSMITVQNKWGLGFFCVLFFLRCGINLMRQITEHLQRLPQDIILRFETLL